ncbi:homing endonuclease associated repeat-containing protein [Fictibacillus enclensis]|uniref:homing endonuclease associated repeat-containing protein n=1 Tax=Fictibacillus enclensis TaxID=1017270 RepID=UPI0033356733
MIKYRELGWLPSDKTYSNRFGSWSNALKQAGIGQTNAKFAKSYSREEIIKRLQHYYEENAYSITYNLYKEKNYSPTLNTIRKRFGTWNRALKAAGIPINREVAGKYTKQQVIRALQRGAGDQSYITVQEYVKRGIRPSIDTVHGLFGSWSNATRAAGLYKMNKDA